MSNDERLRRHTKRGGWSLVELLVALAVISIFLTGVFGAFIQILRASDRSERMTEAYQNARAAVETMAIFIKASRLVAGDPALHFSGINGPTSSGDRADNDKDGRVDEERPNGYDDDGDWVAASDDRHARIGQLFERPRFVGVPDFGDGHVDEDCVFNLDQLGLTTFPNPAIPGSQSEVTTFSIGSWEGENNVLLQQIYRVGSPTGLPETAPLAYNVVSLNFLYWDPNLAQPTWLEQWDARARPRPGPGIELPASVYISVTVYAGAKPLDQVGPNEPLETMTASTIVDIEAVLHDPRYESVRAIQ
jgi:prepilin-type N-terminal cleavage/methylation domain-containing protein